MNSVVHHLPLRHQREIIRFEQIYVNVHRIHFDRIRQNIEIRRKFDQIILISSSIRMFDLKEKFIERKFISKKIFNKNKTRDKRWRSRWRIVNMSIDIIVDIDWTSKSSSKFSSTSIDSTSFIIVIIFIFIVIVIIIFNVNIRWSLIIMFITFNKRFFIDWWNKSSSIDLSVRSSGFLRLHFRFDFQLNIFLF